MNDGLPAASAAQEHRVTTQPAKIAVEGLDIAFTGLDGSEILVLDRLDLRVEPGEFVAIVGPSGCGKSTLLRVISGLLPPSGGRVLVDGVKVTAPPPGVGFMFQRDTLMPWATVFDNIAVGAELAGRSKADIARRVPDLIGFLRLTGFEKHRPHQLSGGMRQRVALGRLLAYEPDLYLMDEPFGALDSQTKAVMGRELLRVWSTHRRSVVFVTHDIEEAVTLADRVIVLSTRPGRIRLDLPITLPRPREGRALRGDPVFSQLCGAVWDALDLPPIA
ncbi:ABC transporter ATP-binding protein [Humitalea sp. 24SJ18S-53]|uniref:ABC transporter ATP-binding protein n=1 Tax=Humitalea sp. 24SJ18S-53 TaxID=3422307 RepID=UPI003D664FCA